MRYEDLELLAIPLPEDLRKIKGRGDYDRLERAIACRLAEPGLPGALRTRLELERAIDARIPAAYPYSFDEAADMLAKALRGFEPQELDDFIDRGMVDFIYINGALHLHELFLSTLIKVRPSLAPRLLDPGRLDDKRRHFAALDAVIAEMERAGGAARRWHVRHTLAVKPAFQRLGEPITVHLPLPVEYDRVRGFRILDAGPGQGHVAGATAPQRTISFQKPLAASDVFFVEYSFEMHMPFCRLDPGLAEGGLPPYDGEDYLGEQAPHIAFTPLVRAAAREIAGEEREPLKLARRVYDYLTTKPIYSFVRNYFTYPNLTEHMLTAMKGDCGIFALTFITLCRCLGIPARWQSGLFCAPHDVGCHDWAQFYCAPWGWLPVDVSFGNAAWHAGDRARWDFYFGHMDPFRLPAARAFQRPFDPPMSNLRSDPYDNQSGEAEYRDAALLSRQLDTKCEIIAYEEI